LPDRDALLAEAARLLAARAGAGRPIALLALGVDHMARVNAGAGRLLGDALLQRVAEVLSRRTRASDVVARAGGDVFLVLLPDVAADEASRMAERLRVAAGHALAPALEVTVSAGVRAAAVDGATAEALVDAALAALAAAKAARRDRVAAG
ncbi:GGDEF domain-containing protein, partial [Roseisolibacter sp. H3M3-2]|uniref:GGDEF domain-containing protein n=1 Tax=Roseisolibacter sp. H3M3-2 TaxID=3031323 RepID=UPI0023DCADBE